MIRATLLSLAGMILLAGCQTQPSKSTPSVKGKEAKNKDTAPLGTKIENKEAAKKPSNPNNPIVLMETSMGPVKIELFEDKAPETVKNILGYVEDKFYDGTIFHRVIPTFMIQGGGFEPGMKEKPTKGTIKNESENGLRNERGMLAMARRPDPHSASCQFFINVVPNRFLDRDKAADGFGYCVFGQVLEGMDAVDKIRKVPTGNQGGHEAVPVQDVLIQSIRRVQ